MSETDKTYDDGVRDGKIEALENIASSHDDRLDSHSRRIRVLERIVWGVTGVFVFIQFLPDIKNFATLWGS